MKMVNNIKDQDPLNRLCADCSLPLEIDKAKKSSSPPIEWVCTKFGVFLCQMCAGLHRKLGRDLSNIKSIKFHSPFEN